MKRERREWWTSCVICGASIRNVGSMRPRTACSEACRIIRRRHTARKHYKPSTRVVMPKGFRVARQRELIKNEKLRRRECVDCGLQVTSETWRDFDFDHRDPSQKSATVSQMMGKDTEAIIVEMAKCDLRCAICHRRKTIAERDYIRAPRKPEHPSLFGDVS